MKRSIQIYTNIIHAHTRVIYKYTHTAIPVLFQLTTVNGVRGGGLGTVRCINVATSAGVRCIIIVLQSRVHVVFSFASKWNECVSFCHDDSSLYTNYNYKQKRFTRTTVCLNIGSNVIKSHSFCENPYNILNNNHVVRLYGKITHIEP